MLLKMSICLILSDHSRVEMTMQRIYILQLETL